MRSGPFLMFMILLLVPACGDESSEEQDPVLLLEVTPQILLAGPGTVLVSSSDGGLDVDVTLTARTETGHDQGGFGPALENPLTVTPIDNDARTTYTCAVGSHDAVAIVAFAEGYEAAEIVVDCESVGGEIIIGEFLSAPASVPFGGSSHIRLRVTDSIEYQPLSSGIEVVVQVVGGMGSLGGGRDTDVTIATDAEGWAATAYHAPDSGNSPAVLTAHFQNPGINGRAWELRIILH